MPQGALNYVCVSQVNIYVHLDLSRDTQPVDWKGGNVVRGPRGKQVLLMKLERVRTACPGYMLSI